MKYLLDTHTALWALRDRTKLSDKARVILSDRALTTCVSILSAWEIAIKVSVGKLEFIGGSKRFIEKMQQNGMEIVDLSMSHIEVVEALPYIHRDPFDRLLIATAKAEGMTIVTADENIHRYDVLWQW